MQEMKRILALDVGDKTIGLALSDPLGMTAQGLETMHRKSIKEDIKYLGEIIAAQEVGTIVVGLPKNMNGTEGERCLLVRSFAEKLGKAFANVEITFWDERLTTVAAEKLLIEADVSRRKRKKVIDKMAAVNILQGFLDSLKMRGES